MNIAGNALYLSLVPAYLSARLTCFPIRSLFEIKDVLVAGDRVILRGEVTGTQAGELFGVPHTGKSFRIIAIDIQTVRDGKIARTFHMENWLSALGNSGPSVRQSVEWDGQRPPFSRLYLNRQHEAVSPEGKVEHGGDHGYCGWTRS